MIESRDNLNAMTKIVDRLTIGVSRFYFRNRISYPYLSGDLFANEADVIIDAKSLKDVDRLKGMVDSATVIFCKGDLLRTFLKDFAGSVSARIIIVGNSDENYEELDFPIPKSIRHLYIQNWAGDDPRVSVLPIGIENLRLGNNGKLSLVSSSGETHKQLDKTLIGPFAPTDDERKMLIAFSNISGPWECSFTRLSPKKYLQLVRQYKFVACPRGNGIDTHRFWETLYRSSIPVVKKNRWSEHVAKLGIPMVQLDNWAAEDLERATREFKDFHFDPNSIPAIWWPYWRAEFNARIF